MLSVVKPLVTWRAFDGIHECRRACGGFGYSHYSRFGELMMTVDVNSTWEGDNNVLLQQSAKFLMDAYRGKFDV